MLAEVLRDEAYLYADNALITRLVREVEKSAELQRSVQARWELSNTLGVLRVGWACLGRFEEVERIGREADPLAHRYGDVGAEFLGQFTSAMRELARGDLDAYAELSRASIEHCRRSGISLATPYWLLARGLLWQGRADEARKTVEESLSIGDEWGCWRGTTQSVLFVIRASAGARDALSFLDEAALLPRAGVTNCDGAWFCLMAAVEGLALLGERRRAGELNLLTLDFLKTGTRVTHFGMPERFAAIAAACGERWQEAEQHFDTALREAESIPHRLEQGEVRRWYGWMLLARDSAGDRERARSLLGEARALYQEMGMPAHVALSEALTSEATATATRSRESRG